MLSKVFSLKKNLLDLSKSAIIILCGVVILFSSYKIIYPISPIKPSLDELQKKCSVDKKNITYKIAVGNSSGSYYEFYENLNEKLPPCISLKAMTLDERNSSNEELEPYDSLDFNKYDLSIKQSDLIYKAMKDAGGENKVSFNVVLPLFEEYVQLYTKVDKSHRESNNPWIGGLKEKVIFPGVEGSGTFKNATDFQKAIGLSLSNSVKTRENTCDLIDNGTVDTVFFTSNKQLSCPNIEKSIRLVNIPKPILEKISNDYKGHYVIGNTPAFFPEKTMLSVKAMLIASKMTGDKEKYFPLLVNSIIENWNMLSRNPYPLKKALNKGNFYTISEISEKLLVTNDHAKQPNSEYFWLLIWISASIIIYRINHNNINYNRLGDFNYKSGIEGVFWHFFYRTGDVIQIISLILIFISLSTIIIQVSEQLHDPSSDFTNKSMLDLMLWTFTFMASGFNNDIYPIHVISRITVAILAAIGLIGPFYIILRIVDNVKERDKSRRKGELEIKYTDHVLICGWNEKVPGILYCLTCDDAPEKKKIIVVAEIDDTYPLDRYEFNKQYVEYYRGDSTNQNTLKAVHAHNASVALVMAGYKKREGRNITSVLTGLSLKTMNPDIFIASELLFKENENYFNAVESNIIIDFEIISNRLLALSVINECVVDLCLDMLTYDKHSEIYSVTMQEIKDHALQVRRDFDVFSNIQKDSLRQETINYLLSNGVNIIGFSRNKPCDIGVVKGSFHKDGNVAPVIDPSNVNFCVGTSGAVVFLAPERDNIFLEKNSFTPSSIKGVKNVSIRKPISKNVIIVGNSNSGDRNNELKRLIECLSISVNISVVLRKKDETTINFDEINNLIHSFNKNCTVLILSSSSNRIENIQDDQGEIDAETILISKSISKLGYESVRIHAELLNADNRHMLEAAGVDTVICECTFVERILTKLAYSRGVVTDFLVSLIDVENNTLLYTLTVDESCEFLGMRYADVWYTPFTGGRLIACIPSSKREKLKNREGDFSTHHITSPLGHENDFIENGDQLIMILDKDKVHWVAD